MATSKAMRIVRGLAGKDATVFNDRLQNGTRSFKVWGWTVKDYGQAKAALVAAGLQVKMVQQVKYSYRMASIEGACGVERYRTSSFLTRLHVVE